MGITEGPRITLELVLQRIHPEDRERVWEVIDRASNGGTGFDIEHRLLMDDGSIKFVRVVAHMLAGDEPDGLLFVGAVTDITDAKRAEEALRRSEGYLAEAQRLTHTGSWAWMKSPGRVFIGLRNISGCLTSILRKASRQTRLFTSASMQTIGTGSCAPFTKLSGNGPIMTLSIGSFSL